MRRLRNAKIIATLGPSSSSPEVIDELFSLGADVFRLNFSHGSHAEHEERYRAIRAIEQKRNRSIAVLVDLQGPKLRVGTFVGGQVQLVPGQAFRLDLSREEGNNERAPLPHPEILAALQHGANLLLDDGRIRLQVENFGPDFAETRVITGGILSDHKGLNVPNLVLPISPLTEKDRLDLEFALNLGADWVALSFVQRPEDLVEARELIDGRARLLSKLEKPQAIEYLDDIVALSDAVMVARGDLGVEVPPERVPILQKKIVETCRRAGVPVVVATQMLESMVHAPAPTRAEASDVATAIYDGADAVMLSAETAAGEYPGEAVTIMERIICQVESDNHYRRMVEASRYKPENTVRDAISTAARQVAETINAAAIVTFTSSGSTTIRAARERPDVPIVSLTTHQKVARQMALVWGAYSVLTHEVNSFGGMVATAREKVLAEKFAGPGQCIVITAGIPFRISGNTNVLRVAEIEEEES